jgi:hypothetical protein
MAIRFPRIGGFIAELDIPEGGAVRYGKTGRDPSHYDLWGDAGAMLGAVKRVSRYEDCRRRSAVYYIILDIENGNYVATYETEAEALDHVHEALAVAGRDLVVRWGLAGKDDAGNVMVIAESESLIERAGGAHGSDVALRA